MRILNYNDALNTLHVLFSEDSSKISMIELLKNLLFLTNKGNIM